MNKIGVNIMTRKVLGLVLAFGFLSLTSVQAEENGPGCGLGKLLLEGKSGMVSHTVAWTLNSLGANGAFGMTFGTSGCDVDQVIKADKEQEVFVAVNMDNLSQEMARGNGAFLQSLSSLMGCSSAVYPEFSSLTREKYGKLFGNAETNSADLLAGLKREMAADPKLAASCDRISS